MKIQLPNGLLDGTDLFNFVTIDEIRGKQQNYLADRDLIIGNIGHIPKILEDLVKSFETVNGLTWGGQIKDAVKRIPTGDIEAILVKIRENTYGPRFYHEAECPHCGELNKDLRIDLDGLQMKVMPLADMMDSSKRIVQLPKSKIEVELKPLCLDDLFKTIKVSAEHRDELITNVLALSIKRMDKNSNVTKKDTEDLPASDIQHLNEAVSGMTLEGELDTDVTNECTKCKKEYHSKLNVYEPSFFAPTRVSKSTNT